MLERLFTFGARHRAATFLLLVGLSLCSVPGLLRLRMDTSYDSLMPPRAESYRQYQQAVEEFGSDKATVVYLRDDNLFTPARLKQVQALTQSLSDMEGVERVDGLFTALNIRDRGEGLETGPLFDGPPEDPAQVAAARADALHNPLLTGAVLSADGRATSIVVAVHREEDDPAFYGRFYRGVEERIAPLRKDFQKVFQIGPPRINVEIERSIFRDLKLLTPLATAVLVASIFYFLGTGVGAAGPLVTAGFSILWTMGFMGYVGIPLSLLTALLPALLIVIGSSEDTHMLAEYLQAMAETGHGDRLAAIRLMSRKIALPIVLNGFTTILGFFANIFNNVILIQDFAVASSAAMFFSMVSTVLFIPLMARTVPLRSARLAGGQEEPQGLAGWVVRGLGHFSTRYRRGVVWGTATMVVVFSILGSEVKVLNDPLSFFRRSHPVVRDANTLHGDLAGMYVFYLVLDGKEPGAFYQPEALRKVGRVQEMGRHLGFDKSTSFADMVSLVHREMGLGEISSGPVPDRRDLIEQYMLFFQRSDLERYISHDGRLANVVVRHHISDSSILEKSLSGLRREMPGILGPGISWRLTGETILIQEAADNLAIGEVKSLSLLIGMVFLIMSVMYTSLLAGFFALIPNIIPIVLNFGVMTLLGIPLNVGTAMVAAIAIGITVDDTTHLLSRYNAERRKTPDPEQALRNTIREEAVPVIATSVSLALGFAILSTSRFSVVAQFGFLSALTMMSGLVIDLMITPMLLRNLRVAGVWDIIGLKVGRGVLEKSRLFEGMSLFSVKKAILLSQMLTVPAGREIVTQGTRGRSMYLILSGSVEVLRQEGGQARRVADLGPGEIFGEVGYSQETERTATVSAKEQALLLALDFASVQKALRWYPGIAARLNLNISRILGERLAAMYGRAGRPGLASAGI